MKIKTHVFHGRLYAEGLKRLRVLGFGLLVIALAASILVPVTFMMSASDLTYDYCDTGWTVPTTTLDWGELCYSTRFLPFVSPIFVLVMFSFLFQRKESDFYHSIPYTRTCVFISFTAAVMTWVWGITLLCSAVSGILWTVAPTASFLMSDLFTLTGVSMLSSALLCGFMLLAVTLCGNLPTAILNFVLFTALPRVMLCFFGYTLDQGLPLIHVKYFCGGFFSTSWCLPLGLIAEDFNVDFSNVAMLVYSAVAAVLLLVASGICYARRRSEMAGSSAQSRKMQTLFRCLFTLPFALLVPSFLLTESFDGATLLVLITVALLVYYLYELITTKKIRNLWRATPYLLVVVAGCLIFVGSYGAVYAAVLYQDIDAEDIAEMEFVSFGSNILPESSYEYQNLRDDLSTDPEMIAEVADYLKASQQGVKEHTYHGQNASIVNIKLKSGRIVSRMIGSNGFAESEILQSERLKDLPQDAEIERIAFYVDSSFYVSAFMYDNEKYAEFISLFRAEYGMLSELQKGEVKISLSSSAQNGYDTVIRIDGTAANGETYSSYYRVIDEMEGSRVWIDAYFDSINFDSINTEIIVD